MECSVLSVAGPLVTPAPAPVIPPGPAGRAGSGQGVDGANMLLGLVLTRACRVGYTKKDKSLCRAYYRVIAKQIEYLDRNCGLATIF